MFGSKLIKKSIQKKIFLFFLLIMIFPTALISLSTYFVSVQIVKDKVSSSFYDSLNYIGNSIEEELAGIEKITEIVYIDSDVQNAISVENQSNLQYFDNMKKVDEVMNNLSIYSSYYNYITALLILGDNGTEYIYGSDASQMDTKLLRKSAWFKQTVDLKGQILWIGVHNNEAALTRSKQVFSLARVINDVHYHKLGLIYLSLDTSFFTEILSKVSPFSQSKLYIEDSHGNVVYPQSINPLQLKEYKSLEQGNAGNKNRYEINSNGQEMLVSNFNIDKYGWRVTQMIPTLELIKDNQLILRITILAFLISFLLTGVFWFFISSKILRPINKLTQAMGNIKGTNQMVKLDIQSEDEIGQLSMNFNYMIERINFLFSQVLHEEQKKKAAEIKALQNQINPHFLHNTLNTIRWMALIQKAEGIKEIVDALGRLLKNSFKNEHSFITLEEELLLVKDYIYIQQTRYRDKFQVKYDVDDSLLLASCVRFVLQPLVENSIFHGIEPKEGPGLIQIKAIIYNEQLRITVEDDGMGMSSVQLGKIKGIGLDNVHDRIKMICGDEFGLEVESEFGAFTRIHVHLPLRWKLFEGVAADD